MENKFEAASKKDAGGDGKHVFSFSWPNAFQFLCRTFLRFRMHVLAEQRGNLKSYRGFFPHLSFPTRVACSLLHAETADLIETQFCGFLIAKPIPFGYCRCLALGSESIGQKAFQHYLSF